MDWSKTLWMLGIGLTISTIVDMNGGDGDRVVLGFIFGLVCLMYGKLFADKP